MNKEEAKEHIDIWIELWKDIEERGITNGHKEICQAKIETFEICKELM